MRENNTGVLEERQSGEKALRRLLKQEGIRQDEILAQAFSDFGLDTQYSDGALVLTKEYVLAAYLPSGARIERQFGGYGPVLHVPDDSRWQIVRYRTDELTELKVERYVTGGALYGVRDGETFKIMAFSNSRAGGFHRIVKLFERLRKNGSLTPEDLIQEENEYCPKCGAKYPEKGRTICPHCMDRKSVFWRVLSCFKPYWKQILIMLVCYVGTALLTLVWPYLNGTVLYDKVLGKDPAFAALFGSGPARYGLMLLSVVAVMFLTKLLRQGLGILQGVLTAHIVPQVVRDLKTRVFTSMGKLSIRFYNSKQTGGLMVRVLQDAEEVTGFFIDGLPYLITNILTVVSTVVVMISLNWKLAIISLVMLPPLFILSVKMTPRFENLFGKRHRARRSMNGQINDNITGARVVKAFGKEDREIHRFNRYNDRVRTAETEVSSYDNRFFALYTCMERVVEFLVWSFGSFLILENTNMEFGLLVTFVGYTAQLNDPLDFLSYVFRWWAESMNSAQRIFEIIDSVPESREKEDPVPMPQIKGDIVLEHVTFGYEPNKPVLKDLNFHVEAGKMLGIVGRSGAGKSTLVNLISRLYDPDEGRILIDGTDVRDMSFADLRRSIAMVSQETYIFAGTVAANIAYANPQASQEDIIRAAKAASAHDFICKMPDGYDTMIGSAGRTLSGGERQRISIARAILADPKILILDEATSAVDTETEQAIQKSLDYLVQGRTTLSIAHRLSTLKHADWLIVVDEGKITERGTHQELLERQGTYFKLMELQNKALALRGIE